MNKTTKLCGQKAQNTTSNFSTIGLYNQAVKDNLRQIKLDQITTYAIKQFKDYAKRNRLSYVDYNKAVEAFNNSHGLLLLKRGNHFATPQKQYAYINYPYLDRQAVKKTMDHYRQYVHHYNKAVTLENESIRTYNNEIVKPHFALSDQEKKRKTEFKNVNSKLFARDYNDLVLEENAKSAILPKRKIQTIKYGTELLFHVLVGFYVSQLKTRNTSQMELNKPTRVLKNSLPKLKIDQRKLATHTIADIPRLDMSKRTVQNHIKRLREAQLLVNYTMINQNKPIQANFNSKIITVLEGNPPKSQTSIKEQLNSVSWKLLPDNNETTRTKILKEKEIKGCAISTGFQISGSMLEGVESSSVCPADGYKNTKEIKKTATLGRGQAQKILPDFLKKGTDMKKKPTLLTRNFLNRALETKDFADKLKRGDFNEYKALRYDYLQKIEQYALVSREEFRRIVIQDFIKSSAKIWNNHDVYLPVWIKTINLLQEQLFTNIINKSTIIAKLREYRWKLEFARKWFVKNKDVNALFPIDYFDNTRTLPRELGFYGLHSVWKTHLKYLETKAANKKLIEQKANARKRKLSAQKKLTSAIHKYESGKYTYDQLYNYVQDHLPHEFLVALPSLIKNQYINLA